jgi:hypothetical protein
VAVAMFSKSNINSSGSLTWDISPITSSLEQTSGVPPLLNCWKALLFFFLADLVKCHSLAAVETNNLSLVPH